LFVALTIICVLSARSVVSSERVVVVGRRARRPLSIISSIDGVVL
jgi:hypothetical protein